MWTIDHFLFLVGLCNLSFLRCHATSSAHIHSFRVVVCNGSHGTVGSSHKFQFDTADTVLCNGINRIILHDGAVVYHPTRCLVFGRFSDASGAAANSYLRFIGS